MFLFEKPVSIFKMSRWDDYNPDETYDPNKDYSVQVQRNDGGLSATQVRFRTLTLRPPVKFFHS